MACTHTDMIKLDRPGEDTKAGAVCESCVKIGADWLHLRMCLTCGHVGCCDDSPNRHARAHFEAKNHPVMTSYEPKERWRYCFVDNTLA